MAIGRLPLVPDRLLEESLGCGYRVSCLIRSRWFARLYPQPGTGKLTARVP